MEQARSKSPLIFFTGILILGIVAVFLLAKQCSSDRANMVANPIAAENNGSDSITLTPDVDNVQTGPSGTPEELVGRISEVALQANNSKNAQLLIDLLGQHNLNPSQIKRLNELAANSRLSPDPSKPFSPVQGTANRWSLHLADNTDIHLELSKTTNGKWQVNRITLPNSKAISTSDPVAVPDPQNPDTPKDDQTAAATVKKFMDAIVKLDPAAASEYVDPSKVSQTTLAGLCIIFEEGKYTLLKEKALRKMFLRDTASGWLVRLEAKNTGESATFAINSKRKDAQSPWKITEINLDDLLADYANRVSDGDIHFSPLVKNPKGGDSLAIYFDLNSNDLTRRTKRQLTIVANLLKSEKDKKLTIAGHTDALGADQYNLSLSKERAIQVMHFLAQNGVGEEQMNIVGYGKTRPRMPNTTTDGSDYPEGRRANRRAEILLDF